MPDALVQFLDQARNARSLEEVNVAAGIAYQQLVLGEGGGMSRRAKVLWAVAAVWLVLGETVGSVPGLGITSLVFAHKPLHPLSSLGITGGPHNIGLLELVD